MLRLRRSQALLRVLQRKTTRIIQQARLEIPQRSPLQPMDRIITEEPLPEFLLQMETGFRMMITSPAIQVTPEILEAVLQALAEPAGMACRLPEILWDK